MIKEKILRQILANDIKIGDDAIADFIDKLKANPQDAFDWADSTVGVVTDREIAKRVLEALDAEGNTLEKLAKYAQRQVVILARNPSHSTSTSSNFVHECVLSSWAKIVDRLVGRE